MKNLLLYVAAGLFVAAIGEYLFAVLIRHDVGGFLGSLAIYAFLLAAAFLAGEAFNRILPSRFGADLAFYLLFSTLGLMIEWFALGNSPWRNPSANQVGMFSFWGSVFLIPRVLLDRRPGLARLQRNLILYFLSFSAFSLAIGFLTPQDYRMFVLVWLVILGYTSLQVFHASYLLQSWRLSRTAQVAAA